MTKHTDKPRLLIMAGGTGGHVFPGLAVASYMQALNWEVEWLGTPDRMEAELVPKHGLIIHFVHIAGVRGKSLFTKLLTPFRLVNAVFQAMKIIRKCKAQVVLGMGGYASGPGGIAAKILGVPLLIHEQNAVFGMTNRYLAKIANVTMTGFNLSSDRSAAKAPSDAIYVGNPIREGFFDIPLSSNSSDDFQASSSTITQSQQVKAPVNILIVGGSLGALALNQIVPEVLKDLNQKVDISVLHQSGKGKSEALKQSYKGMEQVTVTEFIDDMLGAFAWASVIICRAGALTVAEVAGAGRAAIFVPLPIAVDDHQRANATWLSSQDAALLIDQKSLGEQLPATLLKLCEDDEYRIKMAANAKALGAKSATDEVARLIQSQINNKLGRSSNKNTVNKSIPKSKAMSSDSDKESL